MKKRLLIFLFLLVACGNKNSSAIVSCSDCDYYFYETLSNKEKKIYDTLYEGLACLNETIFISSKDTSAIKKANLAIYYDHPELFYYRGGYQLERSLFGVKIEPTYHATLDEATSKQEDIEDAISLLNLPSFESDYEALKYLFEYVVLSVDYDSEATDNQNLYSGLVNRKSVCAGYAREMQYLCQLLGIECLYVSGTTDEQERHAWNIVECDGKYYHIDPTHGDRRLKNGDEIPEGLQIKYIYLCTSDDYIYKNREENMDFDLPICNQNDLNYYQMNCMYFNDYHIDELKQSMKQALQNHQNYWQGQFENKKDFDQALEAIKNNVYSKEVLNYTDYTKVTTKYLYDEDFYMIYCWY